MKSYEEIYQEAQKDSTYWTAKVTHSFAISINNMMVEKILQKPTLQRKSVSAKPTSRRSFGEKRISTLKRW